MPTRLLNPDVRPFQTVPPGIVIEPCRIGHPGGWCWRAVVARLAAAGHRVFTPTLTGVGERHHLAGAHVDLTTHSLDLANLIEWEELRDAVLVCHSYGGMPATGAADRLAGRLAALVYLDAFTPSDGDSALAVRTAEPGFMPLAESEDGACYPPPPAGAFGLEGDSRRLGRAAAHPASEGDHNPADPPDRSVARAAHQALPPGDRVRRALFRQIFRGRRRRS